MTARKGTSDYFWLKDLKENPEITKKLREEILAIGGHHDMLAGDPESRQK